MNKNREQIIQEAGIETANALQQIQDDIEALTRYLGVIRVYGTKGFTYRKEIDQTPWANY